MITKKEVLKNLEQVKKYLKEIEGDEEWVEINNENCPTLSKYGAKPFRIMKKKMRKDGEVWNNINLEEAKKACKERGCRLPKIQEMLALLDHYKSTNKKISYDDKEFLGIEELSYEEDVTCELIDGPISFLRGGYWDVGEDAGAFALVLDAVPGGRYDSIGFRCASDLSVEI